MYQKPTHKMISKNQMEKMNQAGACVFFYTGCPGGYTGCVYGYKK